MYTRINEINLQRIFKFSNMTCANGYEAAKSWTSCFVGHAYCFRKVTVLWVQQDLTSLTADAHRRKNTDLLQHICTVRWILCISGSKEAMRLLTVSLSLEIWNTMKLFAQQPCKPGAAFQWSQWILFIS